MWQGQSSETLNPKCVVDSFSEYVLNTCCMPRLGAEYTAEQDRHICNSQGVQSLALVNKYQKIITLLNTHCNCGKDYARVTIERASLKKWC